MEHEPSPAPDRPPLTMDTSADLTIGELARRTGVNVATLRMWEQRHGFPKAERLPSGHRRYSRRSVEEVLRVKRRREAGARLEAAVAEVMAVELTPPAPSVYAGVRRRHPDLATHQLRKSTLLALTWALEDECCARAQQAYLMGGFQQEQFYRQAERRWRDLSRTARGTWVMAMFPDGATAAEPGDSRPVEVALPDSAVMTREWVLICVAPEFPTVLAAWEIPGQDDVEDKNRVFECIWSLDDAATLDAARVYAAVMQELGHETTELSRDLDRPAAPPVKEVQDATSCFNRVLSYAERLA